MRKYVLTALAIVSWLLTVSACDLFQTDETGCEITSFLINDTKATIDQEQGIIVVPLLKDADYDVTTLIPSFEFKGDSVKVDSTIQTSGKTAQDFTTYKTYVVASGSDTKKYNVYVYLTGKIIVLTGEYFAEEADKLGDYFAYSIKGSTKWAWSDAGGTAEYVQITGYYADDGDKANDDWLINSEALDLSNYSEVYVRFDSCMNYDDTNSGIQFFVSSDYAGSGSPSLATWTDFSDSANWSEGSWAWISSERIDISKFAGESSVYIGFRYYCTENEQDTWELDNIEIFATY
ncbi:MAG: DUF5017 domain-containing protein [Spirochaetales bacterium]|nr:DUF5017 domain-containing protein [Spirochaetales bacterium]